MSKANDVQVSGDHYKAGGAFQHWDYTVRALSCRYLEGNITKYVVRHRKKNGLQDLDKAMHYTVKLMEEVGAGRVAHHTPENARYDVHAFGVANGLNTAEMFIVKRLAYWDRLSHLDAVMQHIEVLRKSAIEELQRTQAVKIGAICPGCGAQRRLQGCLCGVEPGKGYVDQD